MKRILLIVALFSAVVFYAATFAGEAVAAGKLTVERSAIALDVVDHEPVNIGDEFDIYAEKLYCFTKITGGEEGDYVEHVWRWGDKVMARVPLKLGSSMYRTHSSKRIIRVWTGDWTVDVMGPGGEVLDTLKFTILEPTNKYSDEE